MTLESDLKTCPCCRNLAQLKSSAPDYFTQGDWTKRRYWIKCTVCPIKTGTKVDKEKLIIGWNTRHKGEENDFRE